MTDPQLVAYITEQTQEGVSAEVLREALMEQGWHERDIANALHDVAAGLHPVTPGTSIHADLAQVRGMVAHLAGRVKSLEAKLVSAGMLEAEKLLPAPRKHFPWAWWSLALVLLFAGAVWFTLRQ